MASLGLRWPREEAWVGEGIQVGGSESCVAGWKSPGEKGEEREREGRCEGVGECKACTNGGNHL